MDVCVMIVDDDQIFNLMAKIQLAQADISVQPHTFTNGNEALSFIVERQYSPIPILLFLDINMPGISGWQVLDQLQQLDVVAKIHVVIVTSSIDSADQRRASEYPFVTSYLIKPIKYEQLLALKKTAPLSAWFVDS